MVAKIVFFCYQDINEFRLRSFGFDELSGKKLKPVLGIWIRIPRIRMFLGLPDPDPLIRAGSFP
jgi:hypothetical protein